KAESVRDSSPEGSEKPDQASEQPSEAAGLLHSKIQCLMKITGQRCKRGIVGKPLEQFTDIGDPEGTLESGTNLMEAFGKARPWFVSSISGDIHCCARS